MSEKKSIPHSERKFTYALEHRGNNDSQRSRRVVKNE